MLGKILEHEASYLEALPSAAMYEKSFMHRTTITQVEFVVNQFLDL